MSIATTLAQHKRDTHSSLGIIAFDPIAFSSDTVTDEYNTGMGMPDLEISLVNHGHGFA
jgi:hypothetical protein